METSAKTITSQASISNTLPKNSRFTVISKYTPAARAKMESGSAIIFYEFGAKINEWHNYSFTNVHEAAHAAFMI